MIVELVLETKKGQILRPLEDLNALLVWDLDNQAKCQ